MDLGTTSSRYAKAFLTFATENKEEVQVYKEMQTAAEAFIQLPQLQTLLKNPAVSDTQKVELLENACTSSGKLSKSSGRFVRLITQNKRADMMMFFANSYISMYQKGKNFIKGKLTVASPVSQALEEKMQEVVEKLSQSKVEFEVSVDPSIGGGFILEYDTYRMDASVRGQFNKLHRELGR